MVNLVGYFGCAAISIVMMGVLSYGTGNSGIGPFLTFYKSRIQSVMDFLLPGYNLSEFDFSDFERTEHEE